MFNHAALVTSSTATPECCACLSVCALMALEHRSSKAQWQQCCRVLWEASRLPFLLYVQRSTSWSPTTIKIAVPMCEQRQSCFSMLAYSQMMGKRCTSAVLSGKHTCVSSPSGLTKTSQAPKFPSSSFSTSLFLATSGFLHSLDLLGCKLPQLGDEQCTKVAGRVRIGVLSC